MPLCSVPDFLGGFTIPQFFYIVPTEGKSFQGFAHGLGGLAVKSYFEGVIIGVGSDCVHGFIPPFKNSKLRYPY